MPKKGAKKVTGEATESASPVSPALLEGVISSLSGTSGVIKADSGDEYSFRTKDVPEGCAVDGTRVQFSPGPPGRGKSKEGKLEVKFKSIVVLSAAEPAAAGQPADKPAAATVDVDEARNEESDPPDKAVVPGGETTGAATGAGDDEIEKTSAPANGDAGNNLSKERVLRDDTECFVADYTGVESGQHKTPKFEQFDRARRARIARELVEMDPEVELRIRKFPSKDAEEIRVMTADDMVEVVGTCGEWLRLAGDDEQWIKYMQSDNPDIPEQLVDVLGPSLLSVASSFTTGWFSSSTPNPDDEPAATGAGEAPTATTSGGSGWGFSGWGKSLSSYVPSGALERASAAASAMSANVLAVGSEEDGTNATNATNGAASLSNALAEAKQEGDPDDIGSGIADSVARQFDKEVKLDEGGLASVRVASQAISMLEGSLGWLGNTASSAAATVQEKAKSVKESVTSEEFVDKAWSNVKSGVEVGGSVAASASHIAKSTGSTVSAIGKSAISTVGSNARTAMTTAKTTLLGEDEVDEALVYPNRALGGVLAIELSGCIIERDPHVDDEDEDPFMSDDYGSTPMTAGALEAVDKLVSQRFQDRVYLICVAAPQVQARMLRWLSSNNFYEKTGTTREKVHFCREWDEKADVCKELGVTVVVEASSASAGSLEAVVETAILFGDGADVLQGSKPREDGEDGLQSAMWWDSVCAELLPHKATQDAEAIESTLAGEKVQGEELAQTDGIPGKELKKKENKAEEEEEFFSGDEGEGGIG